MEHDRIALYTALRDMESSFDECEIERSNEYHEIEGSINLLDKQAAEQGLSFEWNGDEGRWELEAIESEAEAMSKCGLCGKETNKGAEQRTGIDSTPATQKETPVPYTLPVYCDQCLADMAALDNDAKDMEQIRREWQAYRNQAHRNQA